MRFGEYFSNKRRGLGLTLREFCRMHGLDAGNISKMERGKMSPPKGRAKLVEYAGYLQIKEGSDEWYEFFDLASIGAGKIPDDIYSDEKVVSALPLLFRSLRDTEITEEDLEKIIKLVKET